MQAGSVSREDSTRMARLVGGMAIVLGIAVGLMFWFVLPSANNSFVGSIGMLFGFVSFCVGVGILLYGLLGARNKSKT